MLKKFWELEDGIGLTKEQTYTEEERKCEEIYVKTTKRDNEGRYIVKLPFKTENPDCKRGETRKGIELYTQMKNLLKGAGFTLQKWASNSEELLNIIKEKENGKEGENSKEGINIKMDEVIKILGLTWERHNDKFQYKVDLPELAPPITKRKIIADISRLFDPLGWVTPCIIVAKVLIQKLWIAGIKWCTYRNDLKSLSEVKIPRWVGTKKDDVKRELHGFCDASKLAYAAVVYMRIVDTEGRIHVSLIAAKSKVAPIKQVSIPRLELCGAVELTRLMMDTAKVLKIERKDLHAWTDSTIVLAWLNSLPSRWKVFVANRVAEILTSIEPQQWSHVSTHENPADCASRGVSPSDLKNKSLWLNGPVFLMSENVKYEKPMELTTETEAVRVHQTIVREEDLFEKFSKLRKLVRVVAYCRRFLEMKKPKPERKRNNYLTTEEIQKALEVVIKRDQSIYFNEDIQAIKRNQAIKSNPLKSLNPFIDETNQLLKVGGRLEQSLLPPSSKHPIVMAKNSKLTALLIADAHLQTLHGGPQLTLNYLQNKYFIVGAKQLIKAHVRKCVQCLMGQLPAVRTTPARPFLRSGVDFAGPIQIRTTRGRGHKSYKGYICLFVCMATKAVHVEAVSELTAQGFLQAFKRFVARRGHCEDIWSDNGTNFIGAAGEIQKLFTDEKDSLLPEIAEQLATNNTTWHFIPPHAPNFGLNISICPWRVVDVRSVNNSYVKSVNLFTSNNYINIVYSVSKMLSGIVNSKYMSDTISLSTANCWNAATANRSSAASGTGLATPSEGIDPPITYLSRLIGIPKKNANILFIVHHTKISHESFSIWTYKNF
ncbi:hypothetical protein ABMA27_005575 [Loxostege sticticalis]|uniref:Integrase zinc-binding domain-containing protein n=1 Tax=Loxostege sticticalis TaxID=481309 RepID=A0ABR3HJM7_LOXSC